MKAMPAEKLEMLDSILSDSQKKRLAQAGFFVGLIDDLQVFTAQLDIPSEDRKIILTPKQKANMERATEVRLLGDLFRAISQEYFIKSTVELSNGALRTRLQVAMFRIGDHIKLSS